MGGGGVGWGWWGEGRARLFSLNQVSERGVTGAEQGVFENLPSLVTSPGYPRFVSSRLQQPVFGRGESTGGT